MQETLTTIQNDSTMMLVAGIAIAVLLVVVLVVVVSSMRVKAYKDRFQNLLIEIKEKSQYITTLEKEAEASSVKHAKNKKELIRFDETKVTLKKSKDKYKLLDKIFKENKKNLEKSTGTLHALEKKYETLVTAHEELKEELKTSLDDNSKLRTNNARLLMKLEKEVAQALQEQGKNK